MPLIWKGNIVKDDQKIISNYHLHIDLLYMFKNKLMNKLFKIKNKFSKLAELRSMP